jgi:hypothetical protein
MIIIRTRHRIESTSLMDMNHRYIKGILSAPKVSWQVNLYLGLRAFHREWSLGVESKQSSMIGGLYRLFAIPSFVPHIIEGPIRRPERGGEWMWADNNSSRGRLKLRQDELARSDPQNHTLHTYTFRLPEPRSHWSATDPRNKHYQQPQHTRTVRPGIGGG